MPADRDPAGAADARRVERLPPAANPLLVAMGGAPGIDFDAAAQRAVLRFTGTAAMCNHGGAIQGGFVTAWIDSAMAHAVMLAGDGSAAPASLEVKVAFMRPARPGVELLASGWIVRSGRSATFVEGSLAEADGTVLATATSTVKMVPLARPA